MKWHNSRWFNQVLGNPPTRTDLEVYISRLRRCGDKKSLPDGIRVHQHIISNGLATNTYLGNMVVCMYGKCGSVKLAHQAFVAIPAKNTYSWNIIMGVYAQNGHPSEVLRLLEQMQGVAQADKCTFTTALAACSSIYSLAKGRRIHRRILDSRLECDYVLETALLDMYTKCGGLDEARAVFGRMKHKDVVSWTALITACAQQGDGREALMLYKEMEVQGLEPDSMAYTSVLGACANLRAFSEGKAVHARLLTSGKHVDEMLHNAIINMYSKCGLLEEANALFSRGKSSNMCSWNVIIGAYAQHGHPEEVLGLYAQMELEGVDPDYVTFTSILYVCSHAGMQKQGRLCFIAMCDDWGISATPQHYNCIIDLLGRAGRLDEAEELIANLPYKADFVPWTSLLNACKIHKDAARAARVARLLSEGCDNVLASSNIGRLSDALEVMQGVQTSSVRKIPGCSSIQIEGTVHDFVAGDKGHVQNMEIRAELDKLMQQIMEVGYVPDTSELGDVMVSEKKKQEMLRYHSEKMAMALGLMSTVEPLRIFKNLRSCRDCHAAAKFISQVRKREIVLRDASRFHCFRDGACSCEDYW